MKKNMFNTLLLSVAVALMGCSESDKYTYYEGSEAPDATITVTQESLSFTEAGGTTTFSVSTTKNEWGVYATEKFIKVSYENTNSTSGTVTVMVEANPTDYERSGEVVIMSGTARKSIAVTQEAALESNAPEGYKLVWNDEFNSGSEPNANDWTHEVWGKGRVNNELQEYVNHKTPEGKLVTEVRNGKLRITALKENGKIYSGRVYAKVKEGWTYGYIEASIKLPKGKGTWPAFWMMPVNFTSWPADGEIDIMEEVGGHANYVSSSLHANAHVHTQGTQVTHEMYCDGAEDDFHTYAILWTHDNITTYVDGKVQLSYDNRGLGRDDWPYDDPFYVILNLAWGGDWGGTYGIDESALPATMEVDYVRVFQRASH
jgi:beta-glucanase (GH16 family)